MTGAAIGKDKERLWCILQDESMLYLGGLKALNKTSESAGLAHCMKSSDNGKIKLSYGISDYVPLCEELQMLSAEEIVEVIRSLTKSVMLINQNGLMSLRSVVLEMDKVFVIGDRERGFKTLLIYLPMVVEPSMGGDDGVSDYFRFLRDVLRAAGRAPISPELRPLSSAIDGCGYSLETLDEQLASFVNTESGGKRVSGGEYISGGSNRHDISGSSGTGGQNTDLSSVRTEQSGNYSEGLTLSKRTLWVILTQVMMLALAGAAYFLVSPLAVAAVVFLDLVVVILIFVLTGEKKKKKSGSVHSYVQDDTEEFSGTEELSINSFTPTARLVGQNTPVMLKLNIEKSEVYIGRSSKCDIVIPDTMKSISGRHCRIVTENGVMFVYDDFPGAKHTGSSNGTYVNGSSKRIGPKEKVRLQINDTIQLANYRFRVEHI